MSRREPMWYCHECNTEMRPLMVPDPHCATCNGTFVEKIENPTDDPRTFRPDAAEDPDSMDDEEITAFMHNLRTLFNPEPQSSSRDRLPHRGSSTTRSNVPNEPFTIRIERSTGPGPRMRARVLDPSEVESANNARASNSASPTRATNSLDNFPRLSQFLPPRNEDAPVRDPHALTSTILTQYLLALMGAPLGAPNRSQDPLRSMLPGIYGIGAAPQGAEAGRWGDYALNQEALDQIITQIMQDGTGHQPVPAPESVVENLPREILEKDSPLLEKDCAVCKDQFSVFTDRDEEKITITLPCQHSFHESCILPWLKNSGTCPVCRYQLVPQPDSHPPGSGTATSGPSRSNDSPSIANPGGGLLQSVINLLGNVSVSAALGTTSGSSGSNATNSDAQNQASSSSNPTSGSPPRRPSGNYDVPGSWGDRVD